MNNPPASPYWQLLKLHEGVICNLRNASPLLPPAVGFTCRNGGTLSVDAPEAYFILERHRYGCAVTITMRDMDTLLMPDAGKIETGPNPTLDRRDSPI